MVSLTLAFLNRRSKNKALFGTLIHYIVIIICKTIIGDILQEVQQEGLQADQEEFQAQELHQKRSQG